MGAYSAWFADTYESARPRRPNWPWLVAAFGRIIHAFARRLLRARRVVLVSDFEPMAEQLHAKLGGVPALHALPVPPQAPLAGARYTTIVTGANPLDLGPAAQLARRDGADTVALWLPWHLIYGQTLLHLWRQGFRWGLLLHGRRTVLAPLLLLVFARGVAAAWKRWRIGRRETMTPEVAASILNRFPPCGDDCAPPLRGRVRVGGLRPHEPASPRIAHFMRTWTFGGVERQLGLLASRQHERGQTVRVLLQTSPRRDAQGHLRWLHPAVPATTIATALDPSFPAAWSRRGLGAEAVARLPVDLRCMVLDLAGQLLLRPVDVLHCWIDEANVVGLLAARLAGVGAVVMHALGVSPRHWPAGWQPWMRPIYQAGVQRPDTAVVCLSDAGVRDYADWLGAEPSRLHCVRIAFEPPPRPAPDAVAAFRARHGLGADTPVVVGVFRFDPEKRPLFFLQVVAKLRTLCPDVRVLVAGGGRLGDAVRAEIARLGLNDVVHLLGQPDDVLTPMAAGDVFLMTSEVEGTPNVSLEAQHLGCVPVLTDRCRRVPGDDGAERDGAGVSQGRRGRPRPRRCRAAARPAAAAGDGGGRPAVRRVPLRS
jgi:glycosyltransferase involved in cell wall biosynthesis